THESHQETIDLIKKVREKMNLPIPIMLDTKGPEYRIGMFEDHDAILEDGDTFIFTMDDVLGNRERVSVSYKNLVNELHVGDRILVNNGLLIFEVEELKERDIVCKVIAGGRISNRKSMNFPNHVLQGPYLSEDDKSDILFGIKNDVDYVAASFVSTKEDMEALRNFLDENGGKDIDIVAKIENRSGVNNIDEICEIADGIMVSRGDLGVEIPFVEVPSVQKYLIKKCRMLGKRVITATEMLESMIYQPRPTRAEISDVANAVYDGTSAVMLSGESASGKYPVEAVRSMAEIAESTENTIDYAKGFRTTEFTIKSNLDAVSHAACAMAVDIEAKGIVISSVSGITARMVSRFRSPIDIIGITTHEKAWRKLALSWGVTPVFSEEFNSVDVMFYYALGYAKEVLKLEKGDKVILTGGPANGQPGTTNTIRLESIKK
ncbi:MAG: pyruvate kinase, partial [Lachnospiraceae bacterium]|nr:pyruvate kinase [Candidatus Darwinimomas equi]